MVLEVTVIVSNIFPFSLLFQCPALQFLTWPMINNLVDSVSVSSSRINPVVSLSLSVS